MSEYDVYYFIRKFAAIPEERWPHPYDLVEAEVADAAAEIVGGLDKFLEIEFKSNSYYQQSTPKRRILAALRDVACAQLGEDEL